MTLMNMRKYIGIFLVACLLAPASCLAAAILGADDWDSGSEGWTNEFDVVVLDNPATGGNTGGWLRITFDASADPLDADEAVHVSASDLFAGAWNTNHWIEFDFFASNTIPDHLQIWWGTTNDHIWMSDDLSFSGTGAWFTVTGPTFQAGNWNPDEFWYDYETDFGAIDWIGIYIWRGSTDEEIYGIDNFRLMIPEPAEIFLLAAALVTSVASTRRKRRKKKHAAGVS